MKKNKCINIFIDKNCHNLVLVLSSILFIAALFYGAFFADTTNKAEAQSSGEYLSGWAWGDNFGWVSSDCNDTSSCAVVN